MTTAKFWMVGASLLVSTAAFADVQSDPVAGDPTGAPAPAGTPGVTATTGEAPAGWQQLDQRPLVIPTGKLEVHAGVPIVSIAEGSSSSTTEQLALGATYGVTDKVEAGADYGFLLHPDGDLTTGMLAFHGAYAALKNDKMELAVAGALTFETINESVTVGGMTVSNSTTFAGLDVGAWFRYRVAPKVAIFTGQLPVPRLSSLAAPGAAMPGYQLAIGLNNSGPIGLSLPVGVSFQATPQIFVLAATNLADIYLSNGPGNSSATVIFSDYIPLELGAFYSANDKLDVGVTFDDDLKNAGDAFAVSFAGRYYVK